MAETHTAIVVFSGDRVYKLKKPVRLPFLDFSTREAREAACAREVELNRRFAPDVYLGVGTVVGLDGAPLDHVVVMRRMPAERRLSTLVAGGEAAECLRLVARAVAAFHARADTSPEIAAAGTGDAIAALWERNLAEMSPFVGRVLPEGALDEIGTQARDYCAGRQRLFQERVRAGKIRDGHGDLLADDIFCLDDGPRILDCIDFDDRLRHADVLADVAFLAMDLERLGRPVDAAQFLADYREFAGETYPESLAHLYVAYRALVRSKVACIRADQSGEAATEEAVALLAIAHGHLERARVRLVVVGGLPGTGKSTLAAGIGAARGWAVIRSDEVRKELAGLAPTDHAPARFGRGIYSEHSTQATYRELFERARRMLERGESVVLDASFVDDRTRYEAARVAEQTRAGLVSLACVAPQKVAAGRLASRRLGHDASDATPAVASAMARRADPWPESTKLETTGPPGNVLRAALAVIEETGRRGAVAS